eukprot:4995210-Amphidinium_carterae.1
MPEVFQGKLDPEVHDDTYESNLKIAQSLASLDQLEQLLPEQWQHGQERYRGTSIALCFTFPGLRVGLDSFWGGFVCSWWRSVSVRVGSGLVQRSRE